MKAIILQYRDGGRSFSKLVEDDFDVESWVTRQKANFDLIGVVGVEAIDAIIEGVKSSQLATHSVTENVTECPRCGTRTQFMEQFGKQLHWCMSPKCQFMFVAENDQDDDF